MSVAIESVFAMLCLAVCPAAEPAEITVTVDHNAGRSATGEYSFERVPRPARGDLAEKAAISIAGGRRDGNGGGLDKLCDGRIPTGEDQPSENFFFNAGTGGGRLVVDLLTAAEIGQVNTYSWHPSTRGPQVYTCYASTGEGAGFNRRPPADADPATCGWTLIGRVDTRDGDAPPGGQYGVSVQAREGAIGTYRYLLFDVSATERDDPFGNTFFSEIDVLGTASETAPAEPAGSPRGEVRRVVIETEQGHRITIDTTAAPDLTEWANRELSPVVKEWYPRIVEMLPSEGFEAPASADIVFSDRFRGVAATSGTEVRCAAAWFRRQLEGEAKGAVVHELVHVVQQYGRARRLNPERTPTPGWLVEGIPDYIRWFLYEPEAGGAEIRGAGVARARYDGSYRISANFLNWATERHDRELVRKLNAAARDGKYTGAIWNDLTGHSVEELDRQWRADLEARGRDN